MVDDEEEEAEKYLIRRERIDRNWGVVYLYSLYKDMDRTCGILTVASTLINESRPDKIFQQNPYL